MSTEERSPGILGLTLTVVICAYTMDRWADLSAAVESVQTQREPVDELVLVVDHCPELAARVRAETDGVRIVANRERRGLAGARNSGVAVAHGDVVAFLDDDAVADPHWSTRLLAGYRDPQVVGVGGLVRPWWETGRPGWFPPEFDWVVGCSYRGLPQQRCAVRNFIGANMSFRRSELLAVGGFRTDLGRVGSRPLGCEETELCLRIHAHDPEAVLLYEPAAAVRHHVPPARASWAYFSSRCFAEGLSKAAVARHAGAGPTLSSERTYLRSTIPHAFARGLRSHAGTPRSTVVALATGVGTTLLGYGTGRLRGLRQGSHGRAGPAHRGAP